jgi:hypothetical protein
MSDTQKINPHQINARMHFWGAFHDSDKEDLAQLLVLFFQQKNSWGPVTAQKIETFFKERGRGFSPLETFIGYSWLTKKEGAYEAVKFFINTCYRSSPQK